MEQKVGEKFNYNGVTLEVVEAHDKYSYCDGCYFDSIECRELKGDILGFCYANNRKDGKSVTFKKVE